MGRKNQYIKSKTDYVLRKRHMLTNEGIIYENDKFTIMPEDNPYNDGSIITFSDSNFKFRKNLIPLVQKKIKQGNWIPPTSGFSDYWTADDCVSGISTSEYKIILNQNCNTLRTFAYFGSAVELINATIKDIVLHYPGGIYYLGEDAEEIVVDGVTYYTMANDFEIDVLSMLCGGEDIENPMRVLSASYMRYVDPTTREPIPQPTLDSAEIACQNSMLGEVTINNTQVFVYLDNDSNKILLSTTRGNKGEPLIVPSDEAFVEMYNSLDDFSKVLLNLTTRPLFSAYFDTSYFANEGYKYRRERYTFPSMQYNEWFTPYISGGDFARYYERLIRLASYHDEYDTFNIWRMMTHESIKNLDWTFTTENSDDDFDSSRMKTMLTLYGRQFDDLKRYTDNIQNTNVLSYNDDGCMPDYFLTDALENEGWDGFMVNPTQDNTIQTNILYTGSSVCGCTSSDANIGFMKRLAMNSRYITSLKGTRRGVETILNLFGLKNDQRPATEAGTYQMHEYVAIAQEFPHYGLVRRIIEQSDDFADEIYPFDTLPIALVELTDDSSIADDTNYFIPWFDKNNVNTNYMYFQMNGGWKHVTQKEVNLDITALSAITSTDDFEIYGETVPYMMFLQDTNSLTALTSSQIEDGMICYVYNIDNVYTDYVANEDDEEIIQETSGICFSHYFILKNSNLSTHLGFVSPEESNGLYNCYGWRNIFTREYDAILDESAVTCDGMKVIYLESLMNYGIGNNPHVGYGHYDDGHEYLEYFNQIFKHGLETNKFTRLQYGNAYVTEDMVEEVGFNIDYDLLEDNTKCHYFISDNENRNIITNGELVRGENDEENENSDENTDTEIPTLIPLGEGDEKDIDENPEEWSNYHSFYEELTIPDPEDTEIVTVVDEPASYSVINVKNFHINFMTDGNVYLRKYIENIVMPYLEHMIPSTTIFKYTFDNER